MDKNKQITEKLDLRYLILLMGVAYVFSFAIRMIWVY